MKIIVLGCGLVGRAITEDLAECSDYLVTAVDIDHAALAQIKNSSIKKEILDLSDPGAVQRLLKNYDIAVNAVPGFTGFSVLKSIIDAGVNVVDIAFYPEDPFTLNETAISKDVTAIVDCGVSPGLSNILIGHAVSKLDEISEVKIYVGGLPEDRSGFFEYKVVFSVTDVLEEYIRPARIIEDGKITTKPALSEIELVDFPSIGKLEAFNSDGLRTLLSTIKSKNMTEKTLRYPGHAEKMRTLAESGLLDKEEIELNGEHIVPFNLTAKKLADKLSYVEGDKDITILKVIVNGMKENGKVQFEYNMLDRYDEKSGIHSMARTTGYTASTAVRLLADGKYDKKGIIPPEFIGRESDCYNYILEGLKERGISVTENHSRLNRDSS